MTTTLLGIAIAVAPFVVIIGLLRMADQIVRRREARYARQIALTDAIHRELGAAAAPEVRKRLGGGWLVRMAVPLERPGTVAAIVRITERVFAAGEGTNTKPLRIVLTPAEPSLTGAARVTRPSRRSVGTVKSPAAAAVALR